MPVAQSRVTTTAAYGVAEANNMLLNLEVLSRSRSTDSDVRCSLLLAAVRAFQELAANGADARQEDRLLAEFAEPVVLPDALRPR
jgi:hypothetical protein